MKRFLCAFFIIIPSMLYAMEEGTLFAEQQKRLICDLYSKGMFRSASVEAERLCFYDLTESRDEWNFFRATALYGAGDFRESLAINKTRTAFRNGLLANGCYMRLADYTNAYNSLSVFSYNLNENESWQLLVRRVDVTIETGNYDLAIEETRQYRELFPESQGALTLSRDLEKYRSLSAPSSWTALGLSALVPGAGQVYAGRWKDGLLSFAAVTLAAGATAFCFMHGQADLGWTSGFFTGLFYSGTLYGAWNSAAERTFSEKNRFNRGIRKSHIPSYEPGLYVRKDLLFE